MPLPVKDPDVTYLGELSKDKQLVRDYIAGVRLIDDLIKALRHIGPHCQPHELQRLRHAYIEATRKCSHALTLIERHYFHPSL